MALGGASSVRKRFKIIYLELTNACNFTCDYCPIDQQSRKKVVMPVDFARRIIDEIAENDLTDVLTFHLMGEPYLHKHLAELTGYAEERGIKVRLLTNGSLLERERNEALFRSNLTRLEIGFRTPNESSFAMRLRGGKLTLDEYIRRTKDVIEDKIRLNARTTLCIKLFVRSHAAQMGIGDPYEHLTSADDNLRMARLFQEHTLETARRWGHSTAEWEKVVAHVGNGEYFIFTGVSLGFSRLQDFWVREQRGQQGKRFPAIVGGCSAGFRDDFGILASGEVTTCCVDYDGANVLGDLRKQTLMEVIESDAARRIQRSLARFIPPTPFCRQCLGGPTLALSVMKQASTIAVDIRDRIAPRKGYKKMRKNLRTNELA